MCLSTHDDRAGYSAWQTHLTGKQESHYGEEDGEDEEHVGGAHNSVVGEFVGLAPYLIDVEAYGKDECRHAEQDHCETERERQRGEETICISCQTNICKQKNILPLGTETQVKDKKRANRVKWSDREKESYQAGQIGRASCRERV